jgi:hypothetical protein
MVCSSCGNQKHECHARKSKLIENMPLFLCNDCISGNKEPRYIIIIAGRQYGTKHVSDYIIKRRYCGEEILAKELIA